MTASGLLYFLSWLSSANSLAVTKDPLTASNKTYDYIIVGGGTAGLAVHYPIKHTLYAIPNTLHTIRSLDVSRTMERLLFWSLRLETTIGLTLESLTPTAPVRFMAVIWTGPTLRIRAKRSMRESKQMTIALLLHHTQMSRLCRGKTLGGSSSINGMLWTRGAKAQYDAWSTLLDPQDQSLNWNWDNVSSYMKRAETLTPPNSSQQAKGATYVASYHGTSGPVQAAYP